MKRRLLAVLTVAVILFMPGLAVGQGSGQGLEISPPLLDLKTDPGQTLESEVRIRNVTNGALIVRPQVNDFVSGGEDGQPKLLLEESEESPYSIKSWITTPESIRIEAGEQKTYSLSIAVPDNASPGGHYGVVRFTGTPPELEDTGVSLSASVGSLLLINVSGDIKEDASFVEFYTARGDKKRSLFEYSPVTIVERIENKGNIHTKPKGVVRVTNMLNKEVATFNLNEKNGNVLPSSIRKFEQTLDKKWMIGRYKAQADLVYGEDNKILSRTISFWVIPYKLIFILLFAIILIIFSTRRYNKYIVSKANKRANSRDVRKNKNT